MGKATAAAEDAVRHFGKQKLMQGALVLKDPSSNEHYKVLAEQEKLSKSGAHIEASLFHRLQNAYGKQLRKVPNGTTLLFFNKWSPCKECTAQLIPEVARALDLETGTRRITVARRRFMP
jgi:hypothetical protein